jgi:dihydrolipoamide dehydrogenase
MSAIEVKVPDIGDFKDVPVIEILVKPGDTVAAEDSLVTLESDKATMDVPSPAAGIVREVRVKLGDKVSEGTPIVVLEAAGAGAGKPAASVPAAAAPSAGGTGAPAMAASAAGPVPGAATYAGKADVECDMLVLGAGPGGYSAAFRAADLGMKTVLVERYPELGGVCLNVGCIPSKALLHVAAVIDEARTLADHGIAFGAPQVDLDKLRAWKTKVVGRLTGGLAGMAKSRKVEVVRGVGQFLDAHHLEIEVTEGPAQAKSGAKKVVKFAQAIIAAGSQVVRLPFIPEDPRVIDSTGALELEAIPKRMLVIGGGIIGLEMGTVYSTLGARLDVVEMLDGLMPGADRDLVRVWEKVNKHRFDRIMVSTRTTAVEAKPDALWVTFEGANAPQGPQPYDAVLMSVGRSPNGKKIAADKAGVAVTDRGFVPVDAQMRTNVPHIFAIGDVVGQPMLAHKAVHEGHVAAEAAAGEKSYFDARVVPSVAYTDPEIAWVGLTEDEAKSKGIKVGKGLFPWAASGRAIANGRDEGHTKLLFDEATHRIVGGGIVGTHAGDLIAEIALAIEMGADAVDIGRTIHPHPTLSESVGLAAEAFEGVCTDLPPPRKK